MGTYIYLLKIAYDWSSFVLSTPLRLQFDPQRQIYVVKKCHSAQRFFSFWAQVLHGLYSLYPQYMVGCYLMANKGYIVAYFDFLNYLSVSFGYYVHVYINWWRPDLVERYVEVMQTNPSLEFCRTPKWKVILAPCIACGLVMYLCIMWQVLIAGLDYTSLDGFHASIKVTAREVFWWDGKAEVEPHLALCIIAYLGKVFNSCYIHVPLDIFTLLSLYGIYRMIADYSGCMLRGEIEPERVLELLREYKKIMSITNDFISLNVIHFASMILTYHSVHLFDILHPGSSSLWRISTFFYVSYVVTYFFIISRISNKTKNIKRWLAQNDNYLKISYPDLIHIIYDLLDDRYAIRVCNIYTMTAESSGTMISNVISYCMLVTLCKN